MLKLSIFLVSFSRYIAIRKGGSAYIAKRLGGEHLWSPKTAKEQQLLNIVEEMALASGLPRPTVYILRREMSINAVTAGLNPYEAMIAVTQGALDHLDRDELQGVVAHEFAHILNDDYVLNMKMAGWLHGLLFFYIAGRTVVMSLSKTRPRRGKGSGQAALLILLIGGLLMLGGWFGYLTAAVIEAAFCRSREHLADAFAVQFTRHSQGLARALKKIGGSFGQETFINSQALGLKSFFIAEPGSVLSGRLLSSHPPLAERLQALEPDWNGRYISLSIGTASVSETLDGKRAKDKDASARVAAWSQQLGGLPETWPKALMLALAAEVQASDGPGPAYAQLSACSLDSARQFHTTLPARLKQAINDSALAPSLIGAVFLSGQSEARDRQLGVVKKYSDLMPLSDVLELAGLLAPEAKLALLELSVPTLKKLAGSRRLELGKAVNSLIVAERRLDLFQIAAGQILKKTLGPILPGGLRSGRPRKAGQLEAARQDVVIVLSSLAHLGADSRAAAEAAFVAGFVHFGRWFQGSLAPVETVKAQALVEALDRLPAAPKKVRTGLIMAAMSCTMHDHRINRREYELLCALAAALEIALPWPPYDCAAG